MSDSNINPLRRLVVTEQPLDLELLASTVEQFVVLYIDPPKVDFTSQWFQLDNNRKILSYLLGRKALTVLLKEQSDMEFEEKVSPSDIEQATGIPGGSTRPVLKRLREKRLVKDAGGYLVPNNVLEIARVFLLEDK